MKKRQLAWTMGVTTVMALVAGCGTMHPAAPSSSPKLPAAHHGTMAFGPTKLSTSAAWQLNDPGSGAPREELSIEKITGPHISVSVYMSEGGTLNQGTLSGVLTSDKRLKLTGSLAAGTLQGATKHIPMHLILQPISAHTMWVSQYVQGNDGETYSQQPFTENVSD